MFWIILFVVVVERLVELSIAKRNLRRLLSSGAIELGSGHYIWIVGMHAAFVLSLVFEELVRHPAIPTQWPAIAVVLILSQLLRLWVLTTLGRRWTTRVVVLPDEKLVTTGPYRFIRHPNYIVVALELFFLPMLFGLYWTAIVFSILNAVVLLGIRIPVENAGLRRYARYLPRSQYANSATLSRRR